MIFALLVGHRAGGLAGGLARGLALAAAAVGRALLQGGAVQGLDMSHGYLLQFEKVVLLYHSILPNSIPLFLDVLRICFFDISCDVRLAGLIDWGDSLTAVELSSKEGFA